NFEYLPSVRTAYAINEAAAYNSLAYGHRARPRGPVREKVVNADCQIVVWRHEAVTSSDNAMSVVIRVGGQGDVVRGCSTKHAGHREMRRRVHAHLAVPVAGHETEC